MDKQSTTAQRLERKVERAKDPLTRVIRAESLELKMISGRLEIADRIVHQLRNGSGLKYPKAVADQAIEDFLSICKKIDDFDAKYFDYVKRNEKDEYAPLKLINEQEESPEHLKPAKRQKESSNAD